MFTSGLLAALALCLVDGYHVRLRRIDPEALMKNRTVYSGFTPTSRSTVRQPRGSNAPRNARSP